MIRLRKLLATALLTIPVLVFSAAAPTGASAGSAHAAASSPPPGCILFGGRWYCY